MKQFLLVFILFLNGTFAFAINPISPSAKSPDKVSSDDAQSALSEFTPEELMELTPREIKRKTGKKLKFKERIGLKIAKLQYKKAKKRAARGQGDTDQLSLGAFVFSAVGLALFFVPTIIGLFSLIGLILGIVALTSPERYYDKRGKGFAVAAVVISGVIIVIPLILVAIIFGAGI